MLNLRHFPIRTPRLYLVYNAFVGKLTPFGMNYVSEISKEDIEEENECIIESMSSSALWGNRLVVCEGDEK